MVNTLRLADDAGTTWSAAAGLGTYLDLKNSQCAVNPVGTFSYNNGPGKLVLSLGSLRFNESFLGIKTVYLWAEDSKGLNSGWQTVGKLTVYLNHAPTVASFAPATGSGFQQTFTFAFTDGDGFEDIRSTLLHFASNDGFRQCDISVDKVMWSEAPIVSLFPDAGWQATAVPSGSAATLQNSLCGIDVAGVLWKGSGNDLTITVPVFFSSFIGGTLQVGADAWDAGDGYTGTAYPPGLATWVVPDDGCRVSLDASGLQVGSAETTGTVSVTTGSACPWLATSASPWLSVRAGLVRVGSGPLQFTAAANTSVAPRIGWLQIAGLTFGVTQAGVASNRPVIAENGVLNGASFQPLEIAASTWVTILGANLATTTRAWRQSDFAGKQLPTELDGVTVNINGKPAKTAVLHTHL